MCLFFSTSRLLLLFGLLAKVVVAQAQDPRWLTPAKVVFGGGTPQSYGNGEITTTATDGSGNVYVVGSFSGVAAFGTSTLTTDETETDIFVAKWNPASSQFAWATKISTPGHDDASAVGISGASIYVVGNFGYFNTQPVAFGTVVQNLDAALGRSFVAKFTDEGTVARFGWVQQIGGKYCLNTVSALAVSGSSIYLAGFLSNCQATSFGTLSVPQGKEKDAFVAKLTDAGPSSRFEWVQTGGGLGQDVATSVAVSEGNVYLCGQFNSPELRWSGKVLARSGGVSSFIAKFADQGTYGKLVWLQGIGTGTMQAVQLALNGPALYVVGNFAGVVDLGGTTYTSGGKGISTALVTHEGTLKTVSLGQKDGFVAKMLDTGESATLAWAQQVSGSDQEMVESVAVADESVYIGGCFKHSDATLASSAITLRLDKLSLKGEVSCGFIAKLHDTGPAGHFVWLQPAANGVRAVAMSGPYICAVGYGLGDDIRVGRFRLSRTHPAVAKPYQADFIAALSDEKSR